MLKTDEHSEALAYLFGRLNYERIGMPRGSRDLRVARTRRLLRSLRDPHRAYPIIHVAGTKGKGSTAAMIAAALSGAGRRVGLFCSPHLHQIEERFSIDGKPPAPAELVDLVNAVKPAVSQLDEADWITSRRPLTFFEVTTAMGLYYFARQAVDAVVLEVGVGGRLDSTNAVRPAVAVITSISFDHTRQLGNTLAAIAREKAGILKRRGTAVSGVRGDEARAVIEQVAQARGVNLRVVGRDFRFTYEPPPPPLREPTAGHVRVDTWRTSERRMRVPLFGSHQGANAAVALAALDALAEVHPHLRVDDAAIAAGWSRLRFPARVEVVATRPWLVIDGAHNVASAEALVGTLQTHFPDCPRTLIFGTTRDKDLIGQLRVLLPMFNRIVATRYLENPRSVDPAEIVSACADLGREGIVVASDPALALEAARNATSPDGLICVAGSFFLAGEVRAIELKIAPPDRVFV